MITASMRYQIIFAYEKFDHQNAYQRFSLYMRTTELKSKELSRLKLVLQVGSKSFRSGFKHLKSQPMKLPIL